MSYRIFLIDDESAIRDAMAYILSASGFTVTTEATGNAGLGAALGSPSDAVVVDLLLPDLDGDELCARVRESEWPDTPVMIITARNDPEAEQRARDCGANDFMTKPYVTAELVSRVRALCHAS